MGGGGRDSGRGGGSSEAEAPLDQALLHKTLRATRGGYGSWAILMAEIEATRAAATAATGAPACEARGSFSPETRARGEPRAPRLGRPGGARVARGRAARAVLGWRRTRAAR